MCEDHKKTKSAIREEVNMGNVFEHFADQEVSNNSEEGVDRPEEVRSKPPVPLSWKFKDINEQVVPQGWKPFSKKMYFQLLASAIYATVYGMTYSKVNAYYEWPQKDYYADMELYFTPDPIVAIERILSGDEMIFCDGKQYYKNGTGPIFSSQNETTYDIQTGISDFVDIMGPLWGLVIFLFIAFTTAKLYYGKYNQLLGIVKFKEVTRQGVVEIIPVKFSFAFTIMCNAKTFTNLFFTDDVCKLMRQSNLNNHI
jgi:hypothetical protein